MKEFEFTIIASGLDTEADDFEDRLFEAGCGDATIVVRSGAIILHFDREAKNFGHAVVSACRDVQQAGAKIERIEPDVLVSESDIAERANISRAAVSLYAKGARGAHFPAPVARVTTKSPLWDWLSVSRWMYKRGDIPRTMVVEAKIVRGLNWLVRPQPVADLLPSRFVALADLLKDVDDNNLHPETQTGHVVGNEFPAHLAGRQK